MPRFSWSSSAPPYMYEEVENLTSQERRERSRRRREKILVILLLSFIALFTAVEVHLLRVSSELPFVNSIFFFGLMNLNIVLIMLLLFLVFRNVVKVILDERQGQKGSRLRTRLVLSFSLFAIIPTILLFSISAFYIRNSFDKWFNIKIGGTLQKSIEVVKNYYENSERNARHFVRKIAFSLDEKQLSKGKLVRALERARIEYGLDAIEYYASPFSPRVISAHPEREAHIPAASLQTLRNYFSGHKQCQIQNVGVGEIVRCGSFLGAGRGLILADYFIPIGLASQLSEISLTYSDYKSNNPLNYPIKSTYFAILSMMTLLILFSAAWTGFYVAKRLSVPIEEISKGTDQVASGNLDYQIPPLGTDEMKNLVESFNKMTRDLKQSKTEVEATHGNLKRMNQELIHRRRYIEVLLESVQSGVVSLDENGRISMVNHAAAEMVEIPSEELVNRPYWAVLPHEHREEVREVLRTVYGTAKPFRQELRLKNSKGELMTILMTLSVLRDEKKRQLGVVAVFEDVTDIQKIQRMTAWREVAKRIAHEIKNPLTPIQLSVERLRRRYLSRISDDGTFDQATSIILQEVDSLRLLVKEFSSFARLPEIQTAPEPLNEIVLEAANFFRSAHEQILFELELADGLPSMELDRSQLKRVLINLFDNAVAAMEGKGKITVATQHDKKIGRVVLRVSDEGCGIPEGVESQLFEPYFSTKEDGTGLGLAIVHRIVTDHGGFVRVAKNGEKGTHFLIEFPESSFVPAKGLRKMASVDEISASSSEDLHG